MDKIRKALEAVNHIFLCEDEGMASGQPTKEDYLQARELVAAALAELEGSRPKPQDPSAREKALEKDRDNLRRFVEELVASYAWGSEIRFPDEMDGDGIQDLAVKMGILVEKPHPEPCEVEGCPCIEFGPFDFLYHFAWSTETTK